ncbi:MAG: hypothetical protein K0U66_10850 [Gammaproteobacteria bacterium]|nr:hypothetical protein [Gammaproteobacteria bacterium]
MLEPEDKILKKSLMALQRHNKLRTSLDRDTDPMTHEIAAIAVAHAFQISYECLLRALKIYLRKNTKINANGDAKEIFKLATQHQMLPTPLEDWLDYIEIRKHAIQDHSTIQQKDTLNKIDRFIAHAVQTHQKITGQKWQD